jgi:hypothetical protein
VSIRYGLLKQIKEERVVSFTPSQKSNAGFPTAKNSEMDSLRIEAVECSPYVVYFLGEIRNNPGALKLNVRIARRKLIRHAAEQDGRIMLRGGRTTIRIPLAK